MLIIKRDEKCNKYPTQSNDHILIMLKSRIQEHEHLKIKGLFFHGTDILLKKNTKDEMKKAKSLRFVCE